MIAMFCYKDMRVSAALLLALTSLLQGIPARGQASTQAATDPFFGDYEGTYVSSEAKEEAGGPPPMGAAATL